MTRRMYICTCNVKLERFTVEHGLRTIVYNATRNIIEKLGWFARDNVLGYSFLLCTFSGIVALSGT